MKNVITTLLLGLWAMAAPVLANPLEGDFENRLRAAEIAGDRQAVADICKEWYASGAYSSGLLNWNYNALMSVEENGWLFTQQESDTYPALLLQNALNVRPDVRVLSFQWMENQQYRSAFIESENLTWIPKDCSLIEFLNKMLHPKAAWPKPVYFGSMTNKNLLNTDKSHLYLTGLALKFSQLAFDNVATLRYNFENRFRTDYLEMAFEQELEAATVARVNLNYIPALLMLHRHYAAAGETGKAARMQNLALRIASKGNKEAEVSAFFAPEPSGAGIVSALTPKSLEKNMRKVGPSLLAASTELTNGQYEAFLADLLKNKEFEQLAICRTQKTDWVSLLPESFQKLPAKILFEHAHPDDPQCPVQNISYEAAQRYCAWITQVYNASTDKKQYKKVLFRLPTEAEWVAAARAGRKDVPYPWGLYSVRNSKGCYLGNVNATIPCGDCPGQTNPIVALASNEIVTPPEEAEKPANNQKPAAKTSLSSEDGGYFPVKADSYYPNDFGLYALSGNVAEMIAEPGKAIGGSWQDDPFYCRVTSIKEFSSASPAVGFRVFMEIIEE